ncbi:HET domain-containing protein [Colletotrichum higginsianum IMI 349063]|uniref:HET domain-containing protein n=1 Tax=Colletotrichum higginsianum (strain IMI 349063) TaxID=759273 RepID=A0A1B7Y7Z5_COLHI|nr:HET domain-containing protein [Colletotrichum higginsianum IMI 349063]OBR08152.1 HET domain-containing protein [Colletotrichum higginsianum IMI 349063]
MQSAAKRRKLLEIPERMEDVRHQGLEPSQVGLVATKLERAEQRLQEIEIDVVVKREELEKTVIEARHQKDQHRKAEYFEEMQRATDKKTLVFKTTTVMKLLNCSTLKIEEFFGSSIPKSYVVLSHRWEADEVTYQDVINNAKTLAQKRGWAKIRETCRIALERGHNYAWVDTCCIDKTSSAELSEAINSMFKWYANAAVCYVFLSDVGTNQAFAESLWFTRGWTLQELVAPRELLFFDRDWDLIGTGAQLCDVIHRRTGISEKILLHGSAPGPSIGALLSSIPVAVRMSWAATRVTTREEDSAYSLLGIFGVNMPMLYGEGRGAFMRLQEEIIKETNDLTLFAWIASPGDSGAQDPPEYRGILASSPREFRNAGKLELSRDAKYNPEVGTPWFMSFSVMGEVGSGVGQKKKKLTDSSEQYTMTNKGLRIVAETTMAENNTQLLGLGSHDSSDGSRKEIGLYLEDQGGGVFLRAKPHKLVKLAKNAPQTSHTIYLKKHIETEAVTQIATRMKFVSHGAIRFHVLSSSIEIISAYPARMWNPQRLMFITDGESSFAGYIYLRLTANVSLDGVVACGFDPEVKMWFCPGWNGRDAIYEAAMSGDMRRMREIGVRDGRRWVTGERSKKIIGLEVSAGPGQQGFDVSLRQSNCTVM